MVTGMALINNDAAVRRLLDRFEFGANDARLRRARHDGWDATVTSVFATAPASTPGALSPPPALPPLDRPARDAAAAVKQAAKQQRRDQQIDLVTWWLDRMGAADRPSASG